MLFEGSGTNPGEKTLEDKFFEHEVRILIILGFFVFYITQAGN